MLLSAALPPGFSTHCDASATSVGFMSHQSARIHITRVWMLFQGITHQRREYTSSDANPHVHAVFGPQVAQAEFSGYAADVGVSSPFHCILNHILTLTQAHAQDAHQWHHSAPKPAIAHVGVSLSLCPVYVCLSACVYLAPNSVRPRLVWMSWTYFPQGHVIHQWQQNNQTPFPI